MHPWSPWLPVPLAAGNSTPASQQSDGIPDAWGSVPTPRISRGAELSSQLQTAKQRWEKSRLCARCPSPRSRAQEASCPEPPGGEWPPLQAGCPVQDPRLRSTDL